MTTGEASPPARAGALGLLVPDTGNPYFAEYARAVELAAADRGRALLIAKSGSDPGAEARLIADLASRQLDGVIVASADAPRVSHLLDRQRVAAPVVFIDTDHPVPGHNSVGSDQREGAARAVGHLLDVHSHETVALLMGQCARESIEEREVGWRDALRTAGRAEGLITRAAFTRLGGYLGGRQLLAAEPRPTAIFASADVLAVGLLRAAREAGLSIPEDLAIVSFDGTQQADYCWPPLTTMRQPIRLMAKAAVDTALDPPPTSHQLFPVDLVIRRSCGCTP